MESGEERSNPDPEEGPVLVPEDLEIADDEHVTQLDDDRYVVSAQTRDASDSPSEDGSPSSTAVALDRETVHEWLTADLGDANSQYGFDVTARFGPDICQRRMVSNDVLTIFESLVIWYAQQIDADTPVEEVLGILLLESNVPVRYPVSGLREFVGSIDLEPDDAIADLLAVADERDGVQL